MAYHGTNFRWVNRRVHTPNAVFGEVVYEPGGSCGPRVQRDYELILLHAGTGRVTLDGAVHALKAGSVSLFVPDNHDYFEYATERETHHSWCTLRPPRMPGALRTRLAQAVVSQPASSLLRALLAEALKLRPSPARPLDALIEHLACAAFEEFGRLAAQAGAEPGGDPAVNAFLDHVAGHFAEEDCLEGARRASGVSRNTLLKRFHATLRTTPANHLWQVRVERGLSMLAETGHTVAEIAYRCGFKNPFHFSRMLKQRTGQAPREIRRQAWTAQVTKPMPLANAANPAARLPWFVSQKRPRKCLIPAALP